MNEKSASREEEQPISPDDVATSELPPSESDSITNIPEPPERPLIRDVTPPPQAPIPLVPSKTVSLKWAVLLAIICVIVFGVVFGLGTLLVNRQSKSVTSSASMAPTTATQSSTKKVPDTAQAVSGLALDTKKMYGDTYKSGLLPVGDNKYSTSAAKKGFIYSCKAYNSTDKGGAGSRGPWFVNNNTQWDVTKKSAVQGSVSWTPSMKITVENAKRTITTNNLPTHKTGTYPIAATDPAHAYDANPNAIKSQSLSYSLTANPSYGQPQCMGGEVGIMLTGVALFSAFDAGGRDAGAWEVQDGCDGHPQVSGEYHYHTLSRCITNASVKTVLGFALDGFPITGPTISDGNFLTTKDLDECHGITSSIVLDNKMVTMYHYVMTQDFPYSVSCFRATAAPPPGHQQIPTNGTATPPPTMQRMTNQPPPR